MNMKNKCRHKDGVRLLSSFSTLRCFATFFIVPVTAGVSVRFLHTVATKFFLLQYARKWKLIRTPVKNVDHRLDEEVPFKPEKLGIYLDFINFWLKPLSMLECKFGLKQGTRICADFLKKLTRAYIEAYRVYHTCMTTTRQPYTDNKQVRAMRSADPHFLCVPSLHIAIIILTEQFYKRLFETGLFTDEEKTLWHEELFRHGMEIAESVLYLKQHSVNCIPAALYMMTVIAPDIVYTDDVVSFIEQFLSNADDVSESAKKEIQQHIEMTYEMFLLEGLWESDWEVSVLRWLETYKPFPGDSGTA